MISVKILDTEMLSVFEFEMGIWDAHNIRAQSLIGSIKSCMEQVWRGIPSLRPMSYVDFFIPIVLFQCGEDYLGMCFTSLANLIS